MIELNSLWKAVENKQAHYARLLSMPVSETVNGFKGRPFFSRGMSEFTAFRFLEEPDFSCSSTQLKDHFRPQSKNFTSQLFSREAMESLLKGFKGSSIDEHGMIHIDSIPYPYSTGKSDITGYMRRKMLANGLAHNMHPHPTMLSGTLKIDLDQPVGDCSTAQSWESKPEDIERMLDTLKEMRSREFKVDYRPEQLDAIAALGGFGNFLRVEPRSVFAESWLDSLRMFDILPNGNVVAEVTLPAVAREPVIVEHKTRNSSEISPQYAQYLREREKEKQVKNSKRCSVSKRKSNVVAARKKAKAARKQKRK